MAGAAYSSSARWGCPAQRLCLAQAGVLGGLCLALWGWDGGVAEGVLAGGVVAILPQAWFAGRVFRGGRAGAELGGDKAAAALVVARRGMAAAGGKFLLTAAGFVIVFAAVKPAAAWAVFAGYGAMLAIQIAGGWMLLRSTST